MMFLNRIYTICLFILLMTYNTNSYKWRREKLGNNTSVPLNSSSLRRLVDPLSYEIYLDTISKNYISENIFGGHIDIIFIIEYPTMQINLNYATPRKEEYIYLSRYPYKDDYNIMTSSYFHQKELLSLSFKTEIPAGLYTMQMTYFGSITENEVGLYRTTCKDCTGASRWIFVTQLKPTAAQRVFPCWNDPVFRSRFGIEIQHHRNYTSLSNMPIREEQYINDDIMKTKFHSTAPIPAYLVAFALMDFCAILKEYDFTIRMCSTSLVKQEQMTFAANIFVNVITYMQFYMGIPPQFPEITHIGLPDFSYEAEGYWGLNVYRENHLMYNELLHPIDRKLNVTMYVSTLVALQWIGNLVSPTSWTHMWFCQTLALFYGVKAFIKTYDNEHVISLLTYRLQSLARENHVGSQVDPVMYSADNRDEIDRLFKTSHFTNCLKEYAIIAMLENIVTQSIFLKVTITYLKKHQFSTATPNDFWDILQDIEGIEYLFDHLSIEQIVQVWFEIKSLPVITIARNHIDDFHDDIVIKESGFHVNYFIPMNYVKTSSPGEVSSIMWLYPNLTYSFEITQLECFIANWQYTGFYRVKYDTLSLNILTTYMRSKERTKINVFNRAHIIEEAYYFWMKGELHIDVFLNLIRSISNEEQCVPWYAMQNIIQKMWPFLNIDIGTHAKSVIVDVLDDLLHVVGYTEHPDDTECVKFKRLLATKWACLLYHRPCLEMAKLKLLAHLHVSELKIILPMWEKWTYCNGLMLSESWVWTKTFQEYHETKNKKMLKYLACSKNITLILDHLELAISNNSKSIISDIFVLNSEDRRNIYRSIVRKHISKDEVLDYVLKKIMQMEIDYDFMEKISFIIENVYSRLALGKISSLLFQKDFDTELFDTLTLKLKLQLQIISKIYFVNKNNDQNK